MHDNNPGDNIEWATWLPPTQTYLVSQVFLGVDGCKEGWVVAEAGQDLSDLRFWLATSAKDLFPAIEDAMICAIDIPIGLPIKTNRIPVRQARSGTRGRPPFGRGGGTGKSGSIRFHNASGSSTAAITRRRYCGQ